MAGIEGDGTLTWQALWEETAGTIGDRAQARWLCEEASGAFGPEFAGVLQEPATERMIAHLDSMLARWRAGEPLQYVLGHWAFRRLDLMVDRRVLIPRPETELVAEVALELAQRVADGLDPDEPVQLRCADLGTGTGAIGLSLAFELPRGSAEVWLTDVAHDALDVARANAAGIGMAGAAVRFAHGSWFEALPDHLQGSFGLIVANPPYIAQGDPRVEAAVHEWEPSHALYAGADGLDALRVLAAGAPDWLHPGGWMVLEIGDGQGGEVAALLRQSGLADVAVRRDLAGRERIATARKN